MRCSPTGSINDGRTLVDVHIEFAAFLAIIAYVLLGLTSLIICVVYLLARKGPRSRVIGPTAIVLVTAYAIQIYGSLHDEYSRKAYLKVTNGPFIVRYWIWSEHFEQVVYCDDDFHRVTSFHPTYTYDWTRRNSMGYPYAIDPVYFSFETSERDTMWTFELPEMRKGACLNLTVPEILKLPQVWPERTWMKERGQ